MANSRERVVVAVSTPQFSHRAVLCITIKTFAFLFCAGFLVFGMAGQASAAACGVGPFYVSTSGVDTNNGTSISTPWLHHPWDANKSGLASCTLAAGNIVYMRRGDIWYDAFLASIQAGEAGNQIVTTSINTWYAVSSADAYPILSGAYNPTTLAWTQIGSTDVWYTTTAATPGIVVYNDVKLTLYTDKTPPANNWFWSAADTGQGVNTLYVNVGGGSPSAGILEAGKRGYINLTSAGYQTFSYIEMRVNNNGISAVYNNQKADVIYDNIIIKHALGSGIYQSTNTGTVVSHCTISDVTVYGIQAVSVPGISIHGNTVSYAPQHGILLTTTNGASVDNNIVHDCGTSTLAPYAGIMISNSNLNNVYLNNVYNNGSGYYPSGNSAGIYLVGSSENNSIYRNTITGNYIGIVDYVASGANGNKIFYNLVSNSIVNGIDMKQKGTGYEHVYNNTVIHNPSANNNGPYTGHGIDVQIFGYYTKIANNIVVNIAPYGGNNQAYAISDVGSGKPVVEVWWDNNLAYATNGGDLAQLDDTGGGGVIYYGEHNSTTWANFLTALQGATVGHKVLGMDGSQHGAGVHDVATNPLFVSSSNYHLQNISSAINAGTNSIWSGTANVTDYEGNPITNGSGTIVASGGTVDIGAYEFQDSTAPTTTASVPTGTYNTHQTVTLSCDDGAGVGCDKTYYSIDGTNPPIAEYSTAISIPDNVITTLRFYSKDKSLNQEGLKTKIYTIDTIAPQTSIDSNPNALINTNSATFTFSTNETATFQCKLDSGAYASCSTPKNYTSLSEGVHTFSVKATDTATNEDATPASYAFTVDTLIPTISDLSPNNTTLSVTTTSTNLTLTASESSICKYSTISGTSYVSMTVFDSTNNTTHSIAMSGLNSGTTYDYYIICKDAINESAEAHLTFSIAPEENKISLNSVKIKIERTWNKFKDTIHSKNKNIKLKSEDSQLANGQVKIYSDGKRIETIDINSSGFWDYLLKLKNNADKNIKLKFFDVYGTLIGTKKATVKVDTEKPEFTSFFWPLKSVIPEFTKLNWEVKDNDKIDKYKIYVGGKIYTTKYNTFQLPRSVAKGIQYIKIKAYDQAGNSAFKETYIRVR